MSDQFFCDPKVRAVGKPAVGKVLGSLIGSAVGCAAPGSRCSPGKRIMTGAVVAALGYAIGAAWDNACES